MNAGQHQEEAERLLVQAKAAAERIQRDSWPVKDLESMQHAVDQLIAMARVHAMLAR